MNKSGNRNRTLTAEERFALEREALGDTEREIYRITAVEQDQEQDQDRIGISIVLSGIPDSTNTWFSLPNTGLMPQVGDHVILYGRGSGYPVRGAYLVPKDSNPPRRGFVFYESKEAHQKRTEAEIKQFNAEREEAFYKPEHIASIQEKIASLSPALRAELVLALEELGDQDERVRWTDYSLFVYTEAQKIISYYMQCPLFEFTEDWAEPNYDRIDRKCGVDVDAHSGATHAMATSIARRHLITNQAQNRTEEQKQEQEQD